MGRKINFKLANLLQTLSDALSEREGTEAVLIDNDEYLNGVKKAIPEIEKALDDVKKYLQDK